MREDDEKNFALEYMRNSILGEYLDRPGLTEIAINRPGELHTKINGVWEMHSSPVTLAQCEALARALAVWNEDNIDDTNPILSATLETEERCQIIFPTACQRNTVSITVRKPSFIQLTHQSYIDNGFYNRITGTERTLSKDDELKSLYQDGNIPLFVEKVIEYGKSVFIVGETGSGKTTYMKTLLKYIPENLRIITIEDNPEIKFYQHKNYVHLYYPADGGEDAIVTPTRLIRACYRMNPDRILLAEVRGGEAWDCLKIIGSGHEGLVTSLHAGSPADCITGIIDRCYENTACKGMPYDVLLRKVLNCVDVIISVDVKGNVRRAGEIYFKPLHMEEMKERFRYAA
ncbi:P-type DNA transfer ATPase VirB11 [Escherichia coli]|jgi:type IV secretion system protein VirB11|nr:MULTISPECIES: P-type DNA transfer ATPase VirB11 [Enterobacteriaceae]EFA8811029.1 P-type DNA transfer ATPase VirB11 [Escherichia coli O8:H49]EGF2690833.1 P-type DNA transfer ATPase VirB11 [Shigella sonnei]EEW2040090.1 P-type DNA transfer ATPase VirB11 [Escherichia coli]EFA7679409.1 P-type DNA transfer ATPase VirB11 [Escherichia coli]EFC4551977.1 P-type DNA transfer ATPase VirB11 [Escherichia coli]